MNFRDILDEFNVQMADEGHHHARLGWIQFDCPFCGKDTEQWHMGYSLDGNFVNCWRCGVHSLPQTLMELTSQSYHTIKKLLDGLDKEKFERVAISGKLILPKRMIEEHPKHKRYLKSRGYKWNKIKRLWKIQCITLHSTLGWRIFIPIFFQGQMVSWTTRALSDRKGIARYVSASEKEESIPHKDLLYGEDYARHAVVAVEGPTDVWRGGPGFVGTLGTGFSTAQVLRLSRYPIRAICFDNEPEAQKRAKRLVNDLSVFPGETFNIELDEKDVGEESRKNIKQIRKEILE